jgi:hypothetical protein
MKTAMKLTTGILAITVMMAAGLCTKAVAQSTDAIDQARSVAKSLQQKQANDTNQALDAAGVPDPAKSAPAAPTSAKPAPGAPAPAVKPAVIPGAKPVSAAATPAPKPAPAKSSSAKSATEKPASASSANNQLEKVNVVKGSDTIDIEISSSQAVTPQVYKMNSPARVVVELPGTAIATAQNKIPVGAGGVKGVRIGMDGKTPPTTSVVVDLDKALTYELTPGEAGKAILTLHTQGEAQAVAESAAKANPVVAKAHAVTAKSPAPAVQATAAKNVPPAAKMQPAVAKPGTAPAKVEAVKDPFSKNKVTAQASKPAAKVNAESAAKTAAAAAPVTADAAKPAKDEEKKDDKKQEDKKWAMNGKRDPFFSPVVQQSGSGCSTGKKCLEINGINLRGVVKSDSGFIAVVTNNMNKAYFLRENDPVFNGYVVKITGDSIVFQETVQDKLGKTITREVVKRIFTPAV